MLHDEKQKATPPKRRTEPLHEGNSRRQHAQKVPGTETQKRYNVGTAALAKTAWALAAWV